MIKFLIQTIDGEIVHDFCFELIRSIEYQKWKRIEMDYELATLEEIKNLEWNKDLIPIGTIEFVFSFLKYVLEKETTPKPINNPFNNRIGMVGEFKDLPEKFFIKSMEIFKDPRNGIVRREDFKEFPGTWQISNIENIRSEWRCFVREGKILALQPYNGDPLVFPNPVEITKYVGKYKDLLPAYTMDFAINEKNKTIPIEVHEFFSCGLYGFSDYNNLPWMFIRAWQNIIKRL